MQSKSSKSSSNVIGTFLKTNKSVYKRGSAKQTAPAEEAETLDLSDRILLWLEENGPTSARDLVKHLDLPTMAALDEIERMQKYGLIEKDKDDEGRPTLKLPGT